MEQFSFEPLISIIVPVYNTPGDFLARMIESVQAQKYGKWELCLADGSTDGRAWPVIKAAMAAEPRIRAKRIENGGIAANSNKALSLATGEYIGLLDHDDLLTEDALLEMVRALNTDKQRPDFVYSDEVQTDETGTRLFNVNYKPDFSWDFFLTSNYICHFTLIARTLWERAGFYFAEGYDGSQDHELFLRCAEKAKYIKHLPKVLYHWRAHQASTAVSIAAKPYAYLAGQKAVEAHLARIGQQGRVLLRETPPFVYRVEYELLSEPLVSVVVSWHGDRRQLAQCLGSFERLGYVNYEVRLAAAGSDINALVRTECSGEYVLLLSDEVEPITAGWLREMMRYAGRKDTVAVGGKLCQRDGTVQHGGLVVGDGTVGTAFAGFGRYEPESAIFRSAMTRNVSALTKDWLLMRRQEYLAIGGFDSALTGNLAAADLCLKLQAPGRVLVYAPDIEGFSDAPMGEEDSDAAKTLFRERWGEYRDPFYNENLSMEKIYAER